VNFVGPGRQNANTLRFREIVGVVADIKQKGLDLPALPALYTPFLQDETNHDFTAMNIFVRSAGDPRLLASAIRTQVHGVRSDQPVDLIRTMDDVLFRSLAPRRFSVALLTSFAGLALILSAIGIYGMIAYSVNQRTRELGLRMALGARRGDVLHLVMKEGLLLAATGIVLGVLISLGSTRSMSGLLFGVTPTDLPTFAATAGLLLAVAALACFVPALRAARLDPMTALRPE
jgi:putative ABC transport system permease protein